MPNIIWATGAELNDVTANVELTATAGGGTFEVQGTTVRSGSKAFRASASGNLAFGRYQYRSANTAEPIYFRAAIRFTGNPSVTCTIFMFDTTGSAGKVGLKLTTGGALQLYNIEDSAQVGSDSSALSAGTWYIIEVFIDSTTASSTSVAARLCLDSAGQTPVEFASGTINLATGVARIAFGAVQNNPSLEIFWDDLAIATDGWIGREPKLLYLRPNADGDTQNGSRGGADTGANWSQVSEDTPNDATNYWVHAANGDIFEVNLGASGLTDVTVDRVMVFARVRGSTTGAYQFFSRIKSQSGGTVAEAQHDLSGTAWHTNDDAAPRNPLLISTTDPQSGGAWTPALLDAAQIGIRSTDTTPNIWLSTLWAIVLYSPVETPAAAFTPKIMIF